MPVGGTLITTKIKRPQQKKEALNINAKDINKGGLTVSLKAWGPNFASNSAR